jgi:hypothetical protein
MATGKTQKQSSGGSALGFEATLWAAADKLRGNLDAAEYKHVVLGLIFLKYISDEFHTLAELRDAVAPMLKRISQNIHESRTLAALRDALLPKLLSGELRVPAAVKLVEATA